MAVMYSKHTRREYIISQSDNQQQKKTSKERIEIRMRILQERKEAFNILAKY